MTTSYGRVITKDQVLERNRSPERVFGFRSIKTADMKVKIFGDAAVVTGAASIDLEATNFRHGNAMRFIRVYVRSDGRWRLTTHQATRVIR